MFTNSGHSRARAGGDYDLKGRRKTDPADIRNINTISLTPLAWFGWLTGEEDGQNYV